MICSRDLMGLVDRVLVLVALRGLIPGLVLGTGVGVRPFERAWYR